MKKAELVAKIAEEAGLTKKDVDSALKAVAEVLQDSLIEGETVQIPGVGTFKVAESSARIGRNPKTGEKLKIGAVKKAKFSASSGLKRAVASGTKTGGGGPGGKA